MPWRERLPHMRAGYEVVFTVIDYYDGPRKGIANYQGRPHFYECIFDEKGDGYSNCYRLTALDEETFKLAIEDWDIWQRWELAFHTGKTNISFHPALPEDAARHEELKQLLDRRLVSNPHRSVTQIGTFEVLGGQDSPKGVLRPVQVKWTDP